MGEALFRDAVVLLLNHVLNMRSNNCVVSFIKDIFCTSVASQRFDLSPDPVRIRFIEFGGVCANVYTCWQRAPHVVVSSFCCGICVDVRSSLSTMDLRTARRTDQSNRAWTRVKAKVARGMRCASISAIGY